MSEQFLHHPEICTSFQQMRGCRMAQAVRSQAGAAGDCLQHSMHRRPGLSLVESSTPTPEQQGRSGSIDGQGRPAVGEPGVECMRGRQTVRCRTFLVALAHHPNDSSIGVHVVDIETAQLPTRTPVAYNSSTTSRSRSAMGSSSAAPDSAASSARVA